MSNDLKQRIANQFSRAATSYDLVADIQWQVAQQALKELPKGVKHVLDIGSGTGRVTCELANWGERVSAIDIAPGMVAHAKKAHDPLPIHWQVGDAEDIPLESHSVDCVFSSMVLQWCLSLETAFSEIRRVLKAHGQGTLAIVGEGSLKQLISAWGDQSQCHINAYPTEEEIANAARAAGLSVETRTQEFVAWFPSVRDLMQSIREVGANVVTSPSKSHFDRQVWNRIKDNFQRYQSDQGYPLSYHITFVHIRPSEFS